MDIDEMWQKYDKISNDKDDKIPSTVTARPGVNDHYKHLNLLLIIIYNAFNGKLLQVSTRSYTR